jgi:multidrug efflux pump subunit AcrB
MNKAIEWMAENHVAANILMLAIITCGIIRGFSIKQEIFPEIALDYVSVTVQFDGAGPDEVEEGIILPVEEALAGVDGIKELTSTAAENVGTVLARLYTDSNPDLVYQEIESAVARITNLPEFSEKPVVKKLLVKSEVLSVVVFGDAENYVLKKKAEEIKEDLLNLEGISQAEIAGLGDYEITIEINEENLLKYKVSIPDIAKSVKDNSLNLPGGKIKTPSGEILLRTKEKKYHGIEYENIPVLSSATGRSVKLGQIAKISEGFESLDQFALHNGKKAVIVKVFRTGNEKPVEISESVKKYLQSTEHLLPQGLETDLVNDSSIFLKSRLDLLKKNALIGLILILIILSLFLETKLAFYVMLGIPISFFGALSVLPFFDVSINMMSLFAFILALGIVVDDAIVVGENIFDHRKKGEHFLISSIRGAKEVAPPVIFAVLTTIAAFLPLAYIEGVMGKFIRQVPIVVTALFVFSLIECLFILPAHLAWSGKSKHKNFLSQKIKKSRDFFNSFLKYFTDYQYTKFLKLCLRYRYVTVCSGFSLFLICFGLIGGGIVKFNFMPSVDGDYIIVSVKMPPGTGIDHTKKVAEYVTAKGEEISHEIDHGRPAKPGVLQSIFTLVGGTLPEGGPASSEGYAASNEAQIIMTLTEGEKRDFPASEIRDMWRNKTGVIPGAESIVFFTDIVNIGADIGFTAIHEDFSVLEEVKAYLKEKLLEYPGVFNLTDDLNLGINEFQLNLTEKAEILGLTPADLGTQLRGKYYGIEALKFQKGTNEVKVFVKYPEQDRKMISKLLNSRIKLPSGGEIPFDEAVEIAETRGYTSIKRIDRKRAVSVQASVDSQLGNPSEISESVKKNHFRYLEEKYPGLSFEPYGEQKEQLESMQSMKEGFILALFAIYFLLVLPFNSYSEPFIIMLAIPFGFVGAVFGHIIMGYDLTMLSMFGLVALAGVVVNDSILIIDRINLNISKGLETFDAVTDAGQRRLRPILLTSLTTFFGLTPMIFETSLQAKFLIPMAISLGFGIMFATLIILVLIPAFFMVLKDFTKKRDRRTLPLE